MRQLGKSIFALSAIVVLAACSGGQTASDEKAENTETPSLPAKPTSTETSSPEEGSGWQLFDLTELQEGASSTGYLRLVDEDSLSAGIYRLPAGGSDGQSPHQRDEIYYVLQGEAVLEVEDDLLEVSAGSIAYVQAGAAHRFVDFSEDVAVLVIFSGVEPSADHPQWLQFESEEILTARKAGANVWNVFLSVETMRMGAYLLPNSLGGDGPLRHDFAEINIVLNGEGMFRVGGDEISIRPGSVIFVEADVAHNFISSGDDLDILILIEGG